MTKIQKTVFILVALVALVMGLTFNKMMSGKSAIGAGGDAVFFGFRYMLTAQLLQPPRCLGRTLKIETPGIENFI